ncbi:MAG TPA: SIR2 family protein [Gammaproteobacteria bacterium]|nr:SIR2 family protein [Gammaproteobacteria bacterium]
MADRRIKEILLIPEIPAGLRSAHLIGGKIVPFIGAGLSKLAGCPTWSELANICLHHFIKTGELNYCAVEQLKHLSPRVKLTLAMRLNKQSQQKINFEEIFSRSKEPESLGSRAYCAIQQIANIFLTTNYDSCLKYKDTGGVMRAGDSVGSTLEVIERNRIYKKEDFRPDVLTKSDTVIHLHGSEHDPESMIITTQDYATHYARDRDGDENPVLTFLAYLFSQKTTLFVGYGLEELEILEYICKGQTARQDPQPSHYLIQGFFSHELYLANEMYSYYNDLGIELIPFARDDHDWAQMTFVLEAFSKQIPAQPILAIEKRAEMGRLLENE